MQGSGPGLFGAESHTCGVTVSSMFSNRCPWLYLGVIGEDLCSGTSRWLTADYRMKMEYSPYLPWDSTLGLLAFSAHGDCFIFFFLPEEHVRVARASCSCLQCPFLAGRLCCYRQGVGWGGRREALPPIRSLGDTAVSLRILEQGWAVLNRQSRGSAKMRSLSLT